MEVAYSFHYVECHPKSVETHTGIQTDRQTDTQTDRQLPLRRVPPAVCRNTHRHTDRQTDRHADRHTHRHADSFNIQCHPQSVETHAGIQTDNRQTDRQTCQNFYFPYFLSPK